MKYRLDLNEFELDCFKEVLDKLKIANKKHIEATRDDFNDYQELIDDFTLKAVETLLNNPKKIEYSVKKGNAAFKATEVRSKRAKEAVQNAINILRMENKEITAYAVAKTASISYVTAKKYLNLIILHSINEVEY